MKKKDETAKVKIRPTLDISVKGKILKSGQIYEVEADTAGILLGKFYADRVAEPVVDEVVDKEEKASENEE